MGMPVVCAMVQRHRERIQIKLCTHSFSAGQLQQRTIRCLIIPGEHPTPYIFERTRRCYTRLSGHRNVRGIAEMTRTERYRGEAFGMPAPQSQTSPPLASSMPRYMLPRFVGRLVTTRGGSSVMECRMREHPLHGQTSRTGWAQCLYTWRS